MKKLLAHIVFLILFWQCQEPLDLDFKAQASPYLVVDGFITTQAKAHQVRLSRAVPFVNKDITPSSEVSGADLVILDDSGNEFPLSEKDVGVYETIATFAGLEGRFYYLRITLEEGEVYESVPQKIQPKGSIDDIYFQYEETEFFNTLVGQIVNRQGVIISADFSFPETDSYAAFDRESTYLFGECFVLANTKGICPVADNIELNTLKAENQSLFFINYNFHFQIKYSLNVIMYTMDRRAHQFLEEVQQQLSSSGSIFDPAPIQIKGNIHNISDDSELVLGFFGAYNLTEKRIFISPSDLGVEPPAGICERLMPPPFCFNCLLFPGTFLQRPSFWE